MNVNQKVKILSALGNELFKNEEKLNETCLKAKVANPWFTQKNCLEALTAIKNQMLNADKLNEWLSKYEIEEKPARNVGLVMAGNIPLVGFHDFLCVFLSGNNAWIKASSKDTHLLTYVFELMIEIDPLVKSQIVFAEKLTNAEAIIATGSDNTSRYFEYYFKKYPHIIRKNRNGVAVLSGNETKDELLALGKDIFQYFGLGCRNVSKLYLPEGYDFKLLYEGIESFHPIIHHNTYKNNYDYNRTLLLLNKSEHLSNDFLMVKEDALIPSRIASLHYEYYSDEQTLTKHLTEKQEEIQCIVTHLNLPNAIKFGQSQQPELWDYADGVDTMEFLLKL